MGVEENWLQFILGMTHLLMAGLKLPMILYFSFLLGLMPAYRVTLVSAVIQLMQPEQLVLMELPEVTSTFQLKVSVLPVVVWYGIAPVLCHVTLAIRHRTI